MVRHDPDVMQQLGQMVADAVDKRTATLQAQLNEQAERIQEVIAQNQRFQSEQTQRDTESSMQTKIILTSLLRSQANDIRTRIRLFNDKQHQLTRVQTRVTAKKGSKEEQAADTQLRADLIQGQDTERIDIARVTTELLEEANSRGIQLVISDIQDFVNRPA
jgi:hypothetical protein